MSFTLSDMPDLTDVTAVVTGANSGLGLETAKALAGAGAHVVMTARSADKYHAAETEILAGDADAKLEFVQMDLADLSSVRDAAATIGERHSDVDILVNNAGIMLTPEARTADGFELQVGTNHLGHFAFTGLLLGPLLNSGPARVVTVSSLVHHQGEMDFEDLHQRKGYSSMAAYSRSKLANLLFTLELQRRFDEAGVDARSVGAHPGYSATNLQSTGVQSEGEGNRLLYSLLGVAMKIMNPLLAQSAAQGALPQIYAAVGDVAGGTYWGPQGFREARGKVGPAAINRKARNTEDQRRLWERSVEETGVDYGLLGERSTG